jgi:hypothetical protein
MDSAWTRPRPTNRYSFHLRLDSNRWAHASAANGFLAVGARTVLGTLLPVDALSAASFAARLVYRLADFLPAALKDYGRAIRWTEVVGGMLRMQAVTDILHGLVKDSTLAKNEFERCAIIGNNAINSLKADWLQHVVKAVSEIGACTERTVREKVRSLIPLSDAIRYVQLGNPGEPSHRRRATPR